jgi:hypothetical protein
VLPAPLVPQSAQQGTLALTKTSMMPWVWAGQGGRGPQQAVEGIGDHLHVRPVLHGSARAEGAVGSSVDCGPDGCHEVGDEGCQDLRRLADVPADGGSPDAESGGELSLVRPHRRSGPSCSQRRNWKPLPSP